MHDFSLGGPVDLGGYDGPMLDGKPIHSGNCEDGVYGCRMCNRAVARLTPEERKRACPNWPTTADCDWCHKETPIEDMRGVRPWDEPSCYYEVCKSCKVKYEKEEEAEFEEEERYEGQPYDPFEEKRCHYCNAIVPDGGYMRYMNVCKAPACREKLAQSRIKARMRWAKERAAMH